MSSASRDAVAARDRAGPRVRHVQPVPLRLRSDRSVPAEFVSFAGLSDDEEHLAVRIGPVDEAIPLVRIHSQCMTGDVFRSARCDCGPQLDEALDVVSVIGGYVLYLRQEGRGVGLYNKLDAYRLQDDGLDTYAANVALGMAEDARSYDVAAEMLLAMSVAQVNLLTNNPRKLAGLRANGITVNRVLHTSAFANPSNAAYLESKRTLGAHRIAI